MENNKEHFLTEKEAWRIFYQKYFSLEMDFRNLTIPEKPINREWRLIIIAEGLKPDQVCNCMKGVFRIHSRYLRDLDKNITQNIRKTDKSYAIWVCEEIHPDIEFIGKSTKEVDPDMKIGVTLLERMIHEIVYFSETGNHFDTSTITSCSGSRYLDSYVPSMYWDSSHGFVRLVWCRLEESYPLRGIRRAVSL